MPPIKLVTQHGARREATARFAHDLKNPLSALTMNLEFALSELPDNVECVVVREALADCCEAGRLISNVVESAEVEEARRFPRLRRMRPEGLLRAAIAACAGVAEARQLEVQLAVDDCTVEVDQDLIERALGVILETGLRSAERGARFVLQAKSTDAGVEIWLPMGVADCETPEVGLHFSYLTFLAHGATLILHEDEDGPRFLRICLPRRPHLSSAAPGCSTSASPPPVDAARH